MIVLDKIISEIYSSPLLEKFSSKHQEILDNLKKQIKKGNFLTKNQGALLVTILNNYVRILKDVYPTIEESLELPQFSQPFREVVNRRKIIITDNDYFSIEFESNKKIRNKIIALEKENKIDGPLIQSSNRSFVIELTEKNIYQFVSTFKNNGFDIQQDLLEYFEEIVSIILNNNVSFDFERINNQTLLDALDNEIDFRKNFNPLLVKDRGIKYQYNYHTELGPSLISKIAKRKSRAVWVNSEKYNLAELLQSLDDLKRLPTLFLFGKDSELSLSQLKEIHEYNPNYKKGLYFRYSNATETGFHFNQYIIDNNLNNWLDNSIAYGGILNGKVPKFLIDTSIKFNSVVSFSSSLGQTKTLTYCNYIDLIVYYDSKSPWTTKNMDAVDVL